MCLYEKEKRRVREREEEKRRDNDIQAERLVGRQVDGQISRHTGTQANRQADI